jgi:hypothetical protein
MRYAILASLIPAAIFTSAVAHAAPGTSPLRPLVPAELSARCRALAVVPPSARISDPDFAAHVSVANCMAEEAMSGLALRPDSASIAALDAAAAPSLAILDDVLEHGDARWELVADAAKADLWFGMVVRMRIVTNDPDDQRELEAKLAPWLDDATQATREANDLAGREPLGDDPVFRENERARRYREVAQIMRRERAVERRFEQNQTEYNAAHAEVAADTRLLAVENGRVEALRAAWDRAVADDHPNRAGELAPRHHVAFLDALAARAQLERARQSLDAAEGVLTTDRRLLRKLYARAESLIDRSESR